MEDLGLTLRQARIAAGLSLSGMAARTGYSDGYLGNVETGVRNPTPRLIRAYEQVLGDDVNRRRLLVGMASALVASDTPDTAVDVYREITAERNKLLTCVQTSHTVDKAIGALVAQDTPCVASLAKWSKRGSPILRVNSIGILAKVGSPALDNGIVTALKTDGEARELYLTAVIARVLAMPWAEAAQRTTQPLEPGSHVDAFTAEITNPADSGARWCSLLMLARTRKEDSSAVDPALHQALGHETSREMLRTIGSILAGLDPIRI